MKITKYFFVLVCLISLCNCSNNKRPLIPDKESDPQRIPAVSVYDYSSYGLPLLSDIYDQKSRITHIKLGEQLIMLDSVKTDTVNEHDYCKVELSDGTTGWTRKRYIVGNAFPGAIIDPTPVFERPDILTKSSSKEFIIIDIVAISEEKDNWYKIIGRNHTNTGWIEKPKVILSETDIACVIHARRMLLSKSKEWNFDEFDDFFASSPFKSQKVFDKLKEYQQNSNNIEKISNEDRDENEYAY